ncbi:uncharacterized protein KZ484_025395 [Pholidichthys leucotaenia]
MLKSDMGSITNIPYRKNIFCILLVTLMSVPGLGTTVQISWTGPVKAGFRTTFTCSSSCFPNCTYTWSFTGRTVGGSTFTWTPDGLDDRVELQCTVFDPGAGTSTSTTTIVDIWNPMSVRVSPQNSVPSLNTSLNLICHNVPSGDSQGPSNLIWYKDGRKVTLCENMQLLQNNQTLHFDPLLPSDAGFYQCETYQPTLHMRVSSSGYLLSYYPWNVSISGPDVVCPDKISLFTCLTSCTLNVDCEVRWEFRWSFPLGPFLSIHQNELRWKPSVLGTFQNFTCVAENLAAGRSAEATKMVEVKGTLVSGSVTVQLSELSAVLLGLGLWVLFDS